MKVAVLGAGALGAVYGVRLAKHAGVDVTFVVRPARVSSKDPIAIETVRKSVRDVIESPARSAVVPPDADVIVLTVRTDDLDALREPIGGGAAPIVILTPMLPNEWERMRLAFGDRVFAAMPSVVAYARKEDGVVRYWRPPAPTKIDEPRASASGSEIVHELADALSRAGMRTKLELGVHETNPATTVCFIPIGMLIAVAGGALALAEDDTLLSLATRTCREGVRLAHRIGRPEIWAPLTPVLAAPWALRGWLRGLAQWAPEALFYADEHFGRKLAAQHRAMIRDMIALASSKGLPHEAFDELSRRLEQMHARWDPARPGRAN